MVVVLLIIIILLLAPGLLSLLGVAAVGALGVIAFVVPVVAAIALLAGLIAGMKALKDMTPEARKKTLKKLAIIAVSVLAVVGIFVAIISNMNNEHYLEMGRINITDSVSEADEWFSKLPGSYSGQIVEMCLERAEDRMEWVTDYQKDIKPILALAEKYAAKDAEMLKQIQVLQREYAIASNEGETSRQLILADYRAGRITGEEAVRYAADMYEFVPENRYGRSETNDMRDDALALVEELADEVPWAMEKHEEWSVLPREYQQAIDWMNAHENYQEAAAWFAAHTDYKRSAEYLSLCTGVNKLCGTWKDENGSTLVISVDTTQPVEMLYINQELGSFPWKINLKLTLNGQDISFYHDTLWSKGVNYQCHIAEEDISYTGEIRYSFSYGGSFSPYQIRVQEDGTIELTYATANRVSKSSIERTKQWTKTFARAD